MILVTGASGFIGKNLINLLIKKKGVGNIIALTSLQIEGIKYLLHHNYTFEDNFFIKNGGVDIETIIHCGAFTPKNNSEINNISKCNSNIITTEKLLHSKFPNLKKIIYLSTLDVYNDNLTITEKSLVAPTSLYGYSKLYSEKLVETFCKQKGINYQILRIGHVYGPNEEKYQKVIPIMIKKILSGETIEIFGSGNDIRSFIYIEDVVNAIINAIDINQNCELINIVGGQQITINELAKLLIHISKSNNSILINDTINYVPRNFIFDNTLMKKYLLNKETELVIGLTNEFNYMKNLK